MRTILLSILAAVCLAGCSTPYGDNGLIGGASETQLSATQWQVRFRGNGYTSADKAADFCLLRCADIAIREGYPFFVIVDAGTRVDAQTWEQPGEYQSAVRRTGPNTYQARTTGGPTTWNIRRPTTNNTIVLLKDQTARGDAYDAAIIARSLRKKYGIK